MSEWQPISTAPKDGTKVVLGRHNWSEYPVACWMQYPGNPVLDAKGNDCLMSGWGHDSIGFTVGMEDYWLGWNEDEMPTHWMPVAPQAEAD